MSIRKNVEKAAKEKATQVISQALEGLKLLEAAARTYVKLPKGAKDLSSEKVKAKFKKLGIASQSDLDALVARVEKLEAKVDTCCKDTGTTESAPSA